LAAFETWKIKVVAPAPILNSVSFNIVNKSARLNWQKYACKNGAYIEVWRKVDSTSYVPVQCVTGMPDNLGFELIGHAKIDSTGYTDKHLAAGAKYCYRLVAVFPQPDGGESYVSNEVCMPPILANGAVITNVTIDSTSEKTGQITLKWRPPFEANPAQFPPPYTYKVYRADGYTGTINLVKVSPSNTIPDTLLVDQGLNTTNNIYNYRVLTYDNNGVFMDTSSIASSVRLELKPLFERIELNWNADVPWSNNSLSYPRHLIYRGTQEAAKAITELTLIDSVDVNQFRFNYLDTGQYQSTPLVHSQAYCYAVMTRGTYGNPKIKAPLINFSEITCTIPDNQTKPCKLDLALSQIDCNSCFQIGETPTAPNTVKWKRPADACRKEIKGYNVYAANSVGGTYIKIAEMVTDTFYVHRGLQSYAQCYKVSAVSRAGIEGELSNEACIENCPYYELPNVFTPNGDGCNDLFSAFSIENYPFTGENGEPGFVPWPCGHSFYLPGTQTLDTAKNNKLDTAHYINLKSRCARFVTGISLTVFNRWGREVYRYQYNINLQDDSGGGSKHPNPLFVNWNGKDNNGRDLDPGVYYYGANVTFEVADPKKANKTIKGWVQIIR
jgi:fibronectin type 3 domain-containing protein